MAVAVVVADDVHLIAFPELILGQGLDQSLRQLAAPHLGDQFGAAIAMHAGAAVGADLQAHPGAPAGGRTGAHRFGHALPVEAAEALQLVGHHLALDPTQCRRIDEGLIATPGAVVAGHRTQRLDPVGRGFEHLDGVGVPIGSALVGDVRPDGLAGQRVTHEHHPTVVACHAAAAVGGGAHCQGQGVQLTMPRRVSPGAEPGGRVMFTRSDELSCHGTEVTITLGMNNSLPLSRNALWLCSTPSHQ